MSLKEFFRHWFMWRWMDRPQPGWVYVFNDALKDPFQKPLTYTVLDIKGDYVRVAPGGLRAETKELRALLAFYTRIA